MGLGLMGCGCNDKAPSIPVTSGDVAAGRFLVRANDGTSVNFESYADAVAYRAAHGGSLDVAR